MSEVVLLYDIKKSYKQEYIERELMWYDALKREMVEFKGGRLEYEYKEDPYLVKMGEDGRRRLGISSTWRVVPKVVPLKVINYNKPIVNTNSDYIIKACDTYAIYNNDINIITETDDGLVVMVDDEHVDDFCYQMERQGIRFVR